MTTTMIPGLTYNPTIESTLQLISELKPERVDGIKRAAKQRLFQATRKLYPTQRLIVRDMTPQDLAESYIEWWDTSGGSANAWEAHQIESQSVADGRFVCIYGCHALSGQIPTSLPVTALKFDVGGATVALWDIHKAWPTCGVGATIANLLGGGIVVPGLITESPIVISENIEVTVYQWVATASTTFCLTLDGYTCELEGRVLKP